MMDDTTSTVIDLSRLADEVYEKNSSSLEVTQESPEEPSHLSLDDINLEGNNNNNIINSHNSNNSNNNFGIDINSIHHDNNNSIDVSTINSVNGSTSAKDNNNLNITKSNGSNTSTNITVIKSPPPPEVFSLNPVDNNHQDNNNSGSNNINNINNSNNSDNNNNNCNYNNNIDDEEFYPQYKLKTPRESKSPEQKQASSPSSATGVAAPSSSSFHHHNQQQIQQHQHTQTSTHSSSLSSSSTSQPHSNINNSSSIHNQQQQQNQTQQHYELQKMFSSQSLHSSLSKSSESVVFTPPDTGTPAAKALEANAAIRMSKFSKTVTQITARRPSLKNITAGVSIFPKKKKKRKGQVEKQNNKKGKVIDKLHELYTLTIGMMLGLRCSVSAFRDCGGMECVLEEGDFYRINKIKFPPKGDMLSNPPIPSHELAHTFKFKSYAPKVFQKIRDHFAIDTDAYMESVCGNCNYLEFISNSKSGQFFFYSHDGKYMIKTQTNEENKFMKKILKDYYYYMQDNPHSLLVRFLGMHRVTMYHLRRKVHFVIMSSVFDTPQPIHAIYDLKGSLIGREASAAERAKGGVLKDLDMVKDKQKLHLGEKREAFLAQIERDAHFLATLNIMDYSLLVGIHDRHKRVMGQRFTSFTSASGHVIIPHSNLPFRQPVETRLSHDGGNSNNNNTGGSVTAGSPKATTSTNANASNINSISPQHSVSISSTVQEQQHHRESSVSVGACGSASSSTHKEQNNNTNTSGNSYGNLNDLKQKNSPINNHNNNNSDAFSVTGSTSGISERRLSTSSSSITLNVPHSLSRTLTAAATAIATSASGSATNNTNTNTNTPSSHNSSFCNGSSNSGGNNTNNNSNANNTLNDISLVDKPNSLFLKLGGRQLSSDTTNSSGVKVNSGRVGYQLLDESVMSSSSSSSSATTTDPNPQTLNSSSCSFHNSNAMPVTESPTTTHPVTLTRGTSIGSQTSHHSSHHQHSHHHHHRSNNNRQSSGSNSNNNSHNKITVKDNNNNTNSATKDKSSSPSSPSSPYKKTPLHSHTTPQHPHSSSQQSVSSKQSRSRTHSNSNVNSNTNTAVHNTPRSILSEVVPPSHYVDDISDSENGGDNEGDNDNGDNTAIGTATVCDEVYDNDDDGIENLHNHHYDIDDDDNDDDEENNSGSDSEFYESDSDLGDSEYCATPRQSMGSHAYATGTSLLSTAKGHLHNFSSSSAGGGGGIFSSTSLNNNNNNNNNSNIAYPTATTGVSGSSYNNINSNTSNVNPSEFQGKMSSDVGISTAMLNDNRRQPPPISESQQRGGGVGSGVGNITGISLNSLNSSTSTAINNNNSNTSAYSPTKSQLRGSLMSSMFRSRGSSNSLGYSNYSSPHDSRNNSATTTGNNSLSNTTETTVRGSMSSGNSRNSTRLTFSNVASLFSSGGSGGGRNSSSHNGGVGSNGELQQLQQQTRNRSASTSYARTSSMFSRNRNDSIPSVNNNSNNTGRRSSSANAIGSGSGTSRMHHPSISYKTSSHPRHASDRPWTHRADGGINSRITTIRPSIVSNTVAALTNLNEGQTNNNSSSSSSSSSMILTTGAAANSHHHSTTTITTSSHRGEEIYFIGIIDILQVYNMSKRMETMIKSITNDSTQISSVNSRYYAERFLKFIKDNSD